MLTVLPPVPTQLLDDEKGMSFNCSTGPLTLTNVMELPM